MVFPALARQSHNVLSSQAHTPKAITKCMGIAPESRWTSPTRMLGTSASVLSLIASRKRLRHGNRNENVSKHVVSKGSVQPDAVNTVRVSVLGKGDRVPSGQVVAALEALEKTAATISPTHVEGKFELVFTSTLAGVPFIDGYMPNREVISFDYQKVRQMELDIETLPFLPSMQVIGEECNFDQDTKTISYRIRGKDKISTWNVFYADPEVFAARSNVTGLNIVRRIVE